MKKIKEFIDKTYKKKETSTLFLLIQEELLTLMQRILHPSVFLTLLVPLSFKGGVHAMIYWWHQYVKY